MLVWLHPSFTSERVQIVFFNKAAGRARKIWCLGTRLYHTCSCTHERPIQRSKLSSPKTEEFAYWYPLWTEAVVLKTTNWLCKDSQPAGSLIRFMTIHGFCCFRFDDCISICSFHSKYISVLRKLKIALTLKLCTWIWLYGQASMHVTKFWK